MIITVASGKGGTGKTTFSVNLAYALADRGETVRLLDCDVEEPNDHLFVKPEFTDESEVTVLKPVWDADKCTACGKCADACNYNAIAVVKKKVLIFNELCHSCGACVYVCREDALHERPLAIGKVQASPQATQAVGQVPPNKSPFFFAHGLLNIGESLAPKVVQAVKTHIDPDAINILDASPGTACPVVKALEGSDVAVLLTEPTPFGLNDLKLAAAMSLKMSIPTGIVVNRSDGDDQLIADWAKQVGIPIVGRIPFERKYAETYSSGDILVEWHKELRPILLDIYTTLAALRGTPIAPPPPLERIIPTTEALSPLRAGNAIDYKEVTIISGKGGTGKTTVTGSFAMLSASSGFRLRQDATARQAGQAHNQVLADNDVDAADLHLLLTPRVREAHPFVGGTKATVDPENCIGCGRCAEACHFGAFRFDGPANDIVGKTWRIDPLACEGCGLCSRVCPVDTIRSAPAVTGQWFISETDYGPMIHARLGVAEENSGRLVAQVRTAAGELAAKLHAERILGDGPPGTGCPVIASVSGSDLVLIVTEPTVSGVHDMERVLDLSKHFGVPARVIINKADLNAEQAARIVAIAKQHDSDVIAHIPFDRAVNDALMAGKTVIEHGESAAADAIKQAWEKVQATLKDIE
jgi:MinD superfamily P-loop ATPase